MTSLPGPTAGRTVSGPGHPSNLAEQSLRIAPALLTTFLIVVALLSAYEFLFSGTLQRFGQAESIFSIGVSALFAVIPTYLALRKQKKMHGRVLSTLAELRFVEAASKESERRFREMLENVELLAVIIGRNGIVTFCNNYMLQLTGWRRDEVEGKDFFPIFVPGAFQGRKGAFLQNIEAGTVELHIERQIRTKRGDLLEVVWSNTMLRDGEGKITGTASIGDDVTIRRRAEGRLQLQRSVTAVLADAAPLNETYPKILEKLCTGLDWDMAIIWIVDRGAKVLRCAEVWHPPSTEYRVFADENRSRTFVSGQGLPGRVWAEGAASWHEDIATVDGFQRLTAIDAGMHGWIGFPVMLPKRDLGVVELFNAQTQSPDAEMLATLAGIGMQVGQYIDRQQLEEQLRQAQKMEAIGTLAGGVAHDFNNILTVIIGYTELLKLSLADRPEFNEELDAVAKAGARAKDLVKQILTFSRQEHAQRETLQLAPVVEEAMKFLRATIPSTIEIRSRVAADVPAVLADPTEIHQIVMNLGTNAWHAMKDRSGKLDVELESFVVDRELAAHTPQLREGRYARLSVSDTGKGMESATLSRIFEPFFTTKVVGEGTGLGLSVVHGIVQGHDGAITVDSTPGVGTTFRLYFPADLSEELTADIQATAIPIGAGERVLYVDDEAPVANLGKAILERLNYSVDARTDAKEALELIRSEPGRFDLVISDQTMPSMTGVDFARQIKLIRPDLPILLTTGYMGQLKIEGLRPLGISELLPKPVTVRTLGEVVHRMLADMRAAVFSTIA
jgi:PAS domain S-box-containing protein